MRALVVGSGAREHAIVHALRRSSQVEGLFAAPGNAGIAQAADLLPVAADDLPGLAEAASDLHVDLTVVGPELPLALGIADEFRKRGLRLFGPGRLAAEVEASKVFAREFCLRHGIPSPDWRCVRTRDEAVDAVQAIGLPVVFKADGLAAGKGVLIVKTEDDLEEVLEVFFVDRRFGEAGNQVLVEECLEGEELSYMVISDGTRFVPLATSHDYKRALDGDLGPNTGGMGAHSPAVLPAGTGSMIRNDIVQATIAGLAEEGRLYRGVLYVGLMLTDQGPKVLEFNCRLGDPEAQAILLRVEGDLAAALRDAADGRLQGTSLGWRREASACVVMAAEGYPGAPRRGDEITGLDEAMGLPGVTVYHAATARKGDRWETAGGRVVSVCGRGPGLAEALETAYRGIDLIRFDGAHVRRDIGADSLRKLRGGDGST